MEQNRGGRIPWAIALLIVVLTCAIAFGASRLITAAGKSGAYDYKTVNIAQTPNVEVVGDGFIYYDGSAIASVSTQAKVRWSYLIGRNADFDASPYGVAAWIGDALTLIDGTSGTTSFSGVMDADVLSARVGEKYTAVLLSPEHNSTIVLMEQGGRRVNSITLTDQTVIDYGFFSKGTLLWVMSLDTTGTVPSCTINTYRPGRERVGMIHDNEQMMYGVVFQSSYFCVAGDSHLKVYDYTGSEDKSRRKLIYGWYMAAMDETADDPILAFVPNGQFDSTAGMQDVRLIRSNLDQQVRMPYGCQSLVAKNNRVYGFSTEGYVMITEQGRADVAAYSLPMMFDHVYGVTTDNRAILGNGSTVYILNLE